MEDGTKITVRIPEKDLSEVDNLIPKRYINRSGFFRQATKDLLEKESKRS